MKNDLLANATKIIHHVKLQTPQDIILQDGNPSNLNQISIFLPLGCCLVQNLSIQKRPEYAKNAYLTRITSIIINPTLVSCISKAFVSMVLTLI